MRKKVNIEKMIDDRFIEYALDKACERWLTQH